MIKHNTLVLVLPIDQGKHLPQSILQGTKRDRVCLVNPIGLKCPHGGIGTKLAAYSRDFPNLSGYPRCSRWLL